MVDVPIPAVVTAPGLRVKVHVPAGNPLIATEPVATAQVGWVMAPRVGTAGVAGCAFITTLPETVEVHPAALVTV